MMAWFGSKKPVEDVKTPMEPEAEEPRRKIGKYEIVEKIAKGGFGTVYKAWDPMIRRFVALKTCEVPDASMRARAFREAQVAGNLDHPNITTIYEFGVDGIVPFIVQELLSGEDLSRIIARQPPLPLSEKVRILIAVASALDFAHGTGIVHRDIKPSNIRILDNGVVKIMDFGIAKSLDSTTNITKDGTAMGSTAYMSPEQIVGESMDARTDIFSLGIVAYELLGGRKPFQNQILFVLLEEIVKSQARPLRELAPEVPESLAAVVKRAMQKRPEKRFASAGDMKSALESALEALSDAPGHQDIAPEAREAARLLALNHYAILDTAPEEEFDDLTRLASVLCGTPFASLSFADANRLWFKSRVGIEEPATPLEASLGARAIREPDVLVVRDAGENPRFTLEVSGRGGPGVRFYAGAPLRTRDGHVLGTLAVMDRKPRDLSSEQIESLRALSRQTVAQLELRRFKRERADRQTESGASQIYPPPPAETKP
jgi:tRNA A-37 threonylcarbamoyl transferase component Bud32